MKIIATINQKGGVAKTTTTRNVAYVLAAKFQKRVLLIDMDDSGNMSESFDCMPAKNSEWVGAAKLLADKDCDVDDVIVQTKYKDIDIIPSNSSLANAKLFLDSSPLSLPQYSLKRKLDKLKKDERYDFCLIDTKAGLDMLVINSLTAADEAIIPTTVDRDSLKMVESAVEAIEEVSGFSPVALSGVLLTMVNPRTSLDKQGLIRYVATAPYHVFDTYIRQSAMARQSRWAQHMCDEEARGCPPALDYDNLVCELLGVEKLHSNGASRAAFIAETEEREAKRKAAMLAKKKNQ